MRVFFMYPETEAELSEWIKQIQQKLDSLKNNNKESKDSRNDSSAPAVGAVNKVNLPTTTLGVRRHLEQGKNEIAFLEPDDSKVLEFWQIWSESIPLKKDIDFGTLIFEVAISGDMEKLTWRSSGPQHLFIQRMVDFFWNVGAPEAEIDRLNDVGALINPVKIGSWIDMSAKGGMDGGWYFPQEVPMKFALEAGDPGDPISKVTTWAERNQISRCLCVGRDMGAAPPRQTEIRFEVVGDNFQKKLERSLSAYGEFGFPAIPEEALEILKLVNPSNLIMSVITSSEGFVRLGLLVPNPPRITVESLCNLSGGNSEQLFRFEKSIGVTGPEFAEFQYLMEGFGYGVYKEGFDIIFHYKVGEESKS